MSIREHLRTLAAAGGELVLGSVCAGCGSEPGLVCPACRSELIGPAAVRDLPGTLGLPVAGAAAYAGAVGTVIVGHKEHGRLALSRPLGDALSVAVTALLASGRGCPGCGERPVALVPVPSRRSAQRHRGHDPVLRIARRATAVQRRAGQHATVVPALRHARRVDDQAHLGRTAREANLYRSMSVRRLAVRMLAVRCVVLVDDVATTGATLRESTRVLRAAGLQPCGGAVIAVAG